MARDEVTIVVIPDGLRRPLRWTGLGLLTAALLGAGATAAASVADRDPAPAPVATTALLLSGSSLSYAQGQQAAEHLGWDAGVYTLPGAGLSRSTLGDEDSIAATALRLLPSPQQAPDVVVIQGGEADHASSPAVLEQTTAQLLDRLQATLDEGTQLVLVGPIPGGTVPDSLRTVTGVLAEVSREHAVPYVDPIGLGWRVGDPAVAAALAEQLDAVLDPS